MAWQKSPPELIEAFYAALPADPRVDRRKMFGFPCAFVNGNMFVGLHESNLIVRLDEKKREDLFTLGGAVFAPMKGRIMREYVAVPEKMKTGPASLAAWVEQAFNYAATLPKKKAKKASASPKTAPKTPAKTTAKPKKKAPSRKSNQRR